jgi:DNA gyrase subunit B
MASEQNNTDEHIRSLSPLEHIRLRPGMYVGGIDTRAMHHLVYEVLDHMVEEAFVGRCDHIWIELRDDNEISIRDNSMGLPVKPYKETPLTQMEAILEIIGLRKPQLEPEVYQYRVTGGLHGVGLGAVMALSARMTVQNQREGFLWQKTYEKGQAQTILSKSPLIDPNETGTTFIFRPDDTIFEPNVFDQMRLEKRAQQLTALHAGLSITLTDMRIQPVWQHTYVAPEGLKTLVKDMPQSAHALHEPVHSQQDVVISREGKPDITVGLEIAFQFSTDDTTHLYSYINTVEITDGGTQITALKTALVRQFNRYLKSYPDRFAKMPHFTWSEIFRGLTAAISIRHPQPSFASPTKVQLGNPEIEAPVSQLVSKAFKKQIDPQTMEKLVMHYLSKRGLLD